MTFNVFNGPSKWLVKLFLSQGTQHLGRIQGRYGKPLFLSMQMKPGERRSGYPGQERICPFVSPRSVDSPTGHYPPEEMECMLGLPIILLPAFGKMGCYEKKHAADLLPPPDVVLALVLNSIVYFSMK